MMGVALASASMFEKSMGPSSPKELTEVAGQLGEDFIEAGVIGAVALLDDRLDLRDGGDDDVDVLAEGEAQVLGDLRIERIGDGDGDGIAGGGEGDGAVEPREAGLDEAEGLRRRLEGGEIDDVGAERFGDVLIKALRGDKAEVHQGFDDVLAGGVDFLQYVVGLGLVNDALVNKEIGY
jgi:hypothetical protein